MIRLTYIATIILFMTSCTNSNKNQTNELKNQIDSINVSHDQDSLIQKEKDTLNSAPQITTDKTNNKNQSKNKEESQPPTRYMEFPGDANFNGAPMTQQVDISKEVIEKHPDTLSKLAIARYKTYGHFFPKSIADNFEEGISTEHIHYPKKLVFRFELFDNEFAWTPYIVKEVIVKRNPNGELYTE